MGVDRAVRLPLAAVPIGSFSALSTPDLIGAPGTYDARVRHHRLEAATM